MLADMLPPFWDEIWARTEGPLHFRFFLQPAVIRQHLLPQRADDIFHVAIGAHVQAVKELRVEINLPS